MAAGVLAGACDLPELPADQCGNHIIERGEDCDGVGVGSNTCTATCRLSCTTDRACPGGWGCGIDGLCRQPSGELEDFGSAVAMPGDSLALADFDGDGRRDVFARQDARFAIAYVDPAGLSPTITSLSFDATDEFPDVPAMADVDGDGRTDLLLRLEDGISLMRGQADRHLLPTPFRRNAPGNAEPSDLLLSIDVDFRPEAPGDELVAVRDDGIYLLQDPALTVPVKMYSLQPGKHFVTPALMYTALGDTGLQLLVANEGGSTVTVLEPFTYALDPMTGMTSIVQNFEGGSVPPSVVTLPQGATVGDAPLVAHFKPNYSEQSPDIAVPGADGALYVAFHNQSTRVFTSTPNLGDGLARKLVRTLDGVELTGSPLILGLFSNDITSDFVDADGIHVNVCVPNDCGVKIPVAPGDAATLNLTTWAVPDAPEGWVGAKVTAPNVSGVDFGNIVTWSTKPGFTYFRRTTSYFAAFKFPTRGPIDHVDFGDFNGDGVQDLTYTEPSTRALEADPTVRALNVSFGDGVGLPTESVDLGDVGHVDYLFHARVPDPSKLPDAIDDIYVREATSGEYFVFRGSTDRSVQSPLELAAVCGNPALPPSVARVPVLGRFHDGGAVNAAVLFQTEDDAGLQWSLWTYDPSTSDTDEACMSLEGPTSVVAAVATGPGSDDLRAVAADLDRDGKDELVVLPVGAAHVLVASFQGGAWALTTLPVAEAADATSIALLDPSSPASDLVLTGPEGVTILWNDQTLAPTATRLTLRGTSCPERSADAAFGETRSVAPIRIDTGEARTLIAVSDEDSLLLSLDAKARSLLVVGCVTDELGGGGSAVTSGDVTGDGVDDLVVSRAGSTRIFAGIPVVK